MLRGEHQLLLLMRLLCRIRCVLEIQMLLIPAQSRAALPSLSQGVASLHTINETLVSAAESRAVQLPGKTV